MACPTLMSQSGSLSRRREGCSSRFLRRHLLRKPVTEQVARDESGSAAGSQSLAKKRARAPHHWPRGARAGPND
eukprot:gene400-biopygen25